MSSLTVPATSSMGTFGSTRCWYKRSITSVRRRFSDASVVFRMCSGRLSSPCGLPSASNPNPNFVAITTRSRIGGRASPNSSSFVNGP